MGLVTASRLTTVLLTLCLGFKALSSFHRQFNGKEGPVGLQRHLQVNTLTEGI